MQDKVPIKMFFIFSLSLGRNNLISKKCILIQLV